MKCPKCLESDLQELAEEIDIGVGIQKHVYGYECPNCGQISICNVCGAFEGFPHAKWCKDVDNI